MIHKYLITTKLQDHLNQRDFGEWQQNTGPSDGETSIQVLGE